MNEEIFELVRELQGEFSPGSEMEAFHAPIPEDAIDILPTGELYIPHPFFIKRLNQAFTYNWVLLPTGGVKDSIETTSDGKRRGSICLEYALFAAGILIGIAWGEGEIQSERQSVGTALESARSSALTRICMKAGVGLELYDDTYVLQWKQKHATQIRNEKGKLIWVKKPQPHVETNGKTDKFAFLKAVETLKKQVGDKAYYAVLQKYGVDHANKLTVRDKQAAFYRELKAVADTAHEPE